MKLTTDLYAYVWTGADNNCNSYIYANVLNGNKHLLIDPGHILTPFMHEKGYENLVEAIVKDGLKVEDIGLIIFTHAHPDHVEAARKFKEKYSVLTALHKLDEPVLKGVGGGKVDFYLEEGELKHDNLIREKLEVILTPGHSPGEICLYWPAKKALAVGDVIFYHNTGRVDLPGGDPNLLKDSIDRISQLDIEYLLCGHPYDHPGVIQGKEAVKKNIEFVKEYIWF